MDEERLAAVNARVREVLDRLPMLKDDDLADLADEWAARDQAARESGWRLVKRAAEMSELGEILDGARTAVLTWASDRRTDYAGIGGILNRPGGSAMGRQEAVPAILDAVASSVAHESLPEAEYEALHRPWAAISRPG